MYCMLSIFRTVVVTLRMQGLQHQSPGALHSNVNIHTRDTEHLNRISVDSIQ